jgi:hypothetical protein
VDPDIDSKIKRAGDPCIFIFYPTISHFSLLQSSVVDPDVSGPPPVLGSVIILNGSESFHHKAKRVRKTFGFYCFVTSLWHFIIKNDENEFSKSNKQKSSKQKLLFAGILKVRAKRAGPRIRIRTKMSWIHNTAANTGIRNTGLFHRDLQDKAQYIRSGHDVSDPTLKQATAKLG